MPTKPRFLGGFPPKPRSVLRNRQGIPRLSGVSSRAHEAGMRENVTRSFIVRGKGNPESFHSCSHGAGRKMSRAAAKKTFTLADHEAATAGVECRKDEDVIDETPGAYLIRISTPSWRRRAISWR